MRTTLALVVIILMVACNPVDYVADESADRCQEILDEKIPIIQQDIWEQCTSYYEDEVIPEIKSVLKKVIDDLLAEVQDLFTMTLEELEQEVLMRLGCVPDPSHTSGWNCSTSDICQP